MRRADQGYYAGRPIIAGVERLDYGHSRFREYVVAGITRDFLADFPVPVLTVH